MRGSGRALARGVALTLVLAPAAATAAWTSETVAGVGVHLYTPAGAGSRGLMVGLHGCAQSNTVLRDLGGWEAAADRHGLVVALPAAPGGGVIAGCWDYYGGDHTRENRHNGPVLDLVQGLLARDLDPARVYVAGLSSGAGEAAVLACLAPDVFAGVGIAAGPAVGTASSQIAQVATDAATASALCRRLAGPHVGAFETQLASVVAGTQDYIVAQGYADVHAAMFADLYGAGTRTEGTDALPGHEARGAETLFEDADGPRVSLLRMDGLGHAWPAGTGAGGESQFVAISGLSYPEYLAELFERHARRGEVAPPGPDPEPGVGPDAEPSPEPPPEPAAPCVTDTVTATLVQHTARFETFPWGYGAADATYVELLGRYGVNTPFPLYEGPDGHWYADPAHIQGSDCDETPPSPATGSLDEPEDRPEPETTGADGGTGAAYSGEGGAQDRRAASVRSDGSCRAAPGAAPPPWIPLVCGALAGRRVRRRAKPTQGRGDRGRDGRAP